MEKLAFHKTEINRNDITVVTGVFDSDGNHVAWARRRLSRCDCSMQRWRTAWAPELRGAGRLSANMWFAWWCAIPKARPWPRRAVVKFVVLERPCRNEDTFVTYAIVVGAMMMAGAALPMRAQSRIPARRFAPKRASCWWTRSPSIRRASSRAIWRKRISSSRKTARIRRSRAFRSKARVFPGAPEESTTSPRFFDIACALSGGQLFARCGRS